MDWVTMCVFNLYVWKHHPVQHLTPQNKMQPVSCPHADRELSGLPICKILMHNRGIVLALPYLTMKAQKGWYDYYIYIRHAFLSG